MPKDKFKIGLKIKAKHGIIYKYLKDNNLNLKEAAEKIGISKIMLAQVLNFQWFPSTKKSIVGKKLCEFFGLEWDEMFPPELTEQIIKKSEIAQLLREEKTIFRDVDVKMLEYSEVPVNLLTYEQNLDIDIFREELKKIISTELSLLTAKEQLVIKKHFGIDEDKAYTLKEIGNMLGVGQERVRIIEGKALRKMIKHSDRLKKLWELYELSE